MFLRPGWTLFSPGKITYIIGLLLEPVRFEMTLRKEYYSAKRSLCLDSVPWLCYPSHYSIQLSAIAEARWKTFRDLLVEVSFGVWSTATWKLRENVYCGYAGDKVNGLVMEGGGFVCFASLPLSVYYNLCEAPVNWSISSSAQSRSLLCLHLVKEFRHAVFKLLHG